MIPMNDAERFALVKGALYTAVIGDVLDSLGHFHQFLPADVQPLLPEMVVVGRAMPALVGDVFGAQARPFGRLTEALDALKLGDVYLARRARLDCAAWGEILTTAAIARGAVGAVVDGYHRDTRQILGLDFPVFSRGSYGQDSSVRSSVLDYGVPVEIEGVHVEPGDLLVGDRDGVLVIPATVEAEVIERALVKASTENDVRFAIQNGMSSTEAFATYGVL